MINLVIIGVVIAVIAIAAAEIRRDNNRKESR